MSDPEASALAVYWRFFEATNSRDSRNVASTLNYPHVRISARSKPGFAQDAETLAGRMSFEPLLTTGWDHTVGTKPEVLHVAPDKVQIKGGWTRYNSMNEPIMTNMVTYIATLVDGHWGLQSRFGTDSELFWGKPQDRPAIGNVVMDRNARIGERTVASALDLAGVDNPQASRYFHHPHLMIHPGDVESNADGQALADCLPAGKPLVRHVEAIQAGATGVNVTFRATIRDDLVEGVFLVKVEDDRWGIKGGSLIWRA